MAAGVTPRAAAADNGRTVALALVDAAERARVAGELRSLRWHVLETDSGAGLFAMLEEQRCAMAVLDCRLPDLDTGECAAELAAFYPGLSLVDGHGEMLGGPVLRETSRAALLHALRGAPDEDCKLPEAVSPPLTLADPERSSPFISPAAPTVAGGAAVCSGEVTACAAPLVGGAPAGAPVCPGPGLPELIGSSPAMVEVHRRVGLVAARRTPVLIYGPTGTGKELVARALHRLSGRAATGRFVAINCAAIPEALIEVELFGHARGAFTGSVGARAGRIEAADGGTVFLDEIGELPGGAQSKLLRFLESGELQRVGENEPVRVNVRVVAATHRRLGAMAAAGSFRLDLLHRLAVFLIETPGLAGRAADLDALIAHRLGVLAAEAGPSAPRRRLSPEARRRLHAHGWPGNVRELEHTLERAWILAGESAVLDESTIDFGEALL